MKRMDLEMLANALHASKLTLETRFVDGKFVAFLYTVGSYEGVDCPKGEDEDLAVAIEKAFQLYRSEVEKADREKRPTMPLGVVANCEKCGKWDVLAEERHCPRCTTRY